VGEVRGSPTTDLWPEKGRKWCQGAGTVAAVGAAAPAKLQRGLDDKWHGRLSGAVQSSWGARVVVVRSGGRSLS
jgi:hypothetical protein